MDVTNFVLDEITEGEYQRRFDRWLTLAGRRFSPTLYNGDVYFSLENPLLVSLDHLRTPRDYAEFFADLAWHPYASMVAVRHQQGMWVKQKVSRRFDPQPVATIAYHYINGAVVSGITNNKVLWDVFEMKYKEEMADPRKPCRTAVLRFIVRGNTLVSYYLRVGSQLEPTFSIHHPSQDYHRVNHCIVDPQRTF